MAVGIRAGRDKSASSRAAPLVSSRWLLAAGFGGLLLLMAFAQIDAIDALRQIRTADDGIRQDFLLRTRALERIRGDLYLSGTYIRDYLLEPEAGKAEGHRLSLVETRGDMDSALGAYKGLLSHQEARPFQTLTTELAEYWGLLEPVLRWTPFERQRDGYVFLRDEVFPRRTAMLRIADQIGELNEAQLQAGTERLRIVFSEFRRRLTLVIGLTIGLGLALASLTMYRLLHLETTTAAHYREISVARAELKQLSARLVEVQEDERRSISRELHDEVGQALTGVLLEMANLSNLIRGKDPDAAEAKAGEVKRLVENSIAVVRNMALLLRPSMLDDLGLAPALEWQAREVSRRSGLRVKVASGQAPDDLPEEHKTCIYRVAQEALHNCVKHAHAGSVTVSVRQEGAALVLSVEDDGQGFVRQNGRGLGLLGIEERVGHLGGSLEVDSVAGRGTTLRVSLPLAPTPRKEIETP